MLHCIEGAYNCIVFIVCDMPGAFLVLAAVLLHLLFALGFGE